MRTLVLDTEATTYAKGNPFSRRNKLMCVGCYDTDLGYVYFDIEHSGLPYARNLEIIKDRLVTSWTGPLELLIGFNIKYDLHWLRRYIPFDLSIPRVWDCQLAQFILNDQTTPYPSLDECLAQYGLPPKLDRVKLEYWDKGIDTDQVPHQVLTDYNEQDCISTYKLYLKQKELLTGNKLRLFELHCADLLVLQEMEFNGLLFNADQSRIEGKKVEIELRGILSQLDTLIGEPYDEINWNSPAHISTILYGGNVEIPCKVPTERTLKDGTVRRGEKNGTRGRHFDRLCEPLEGSSTVHGWSTAEDTLRSLDATGKAKKLVELVLQVSKLDKLVGTYYNGIPDLIEEMDWEPNTIHSTLNQCMARTGRLSSSKPNSQNWDPRLKPLIYSSYKD